MHTISLKISDALYTEINSITANHKIEKSTLVRRALEYYLKNSDVQKGSFLDLAQDLCGVVEGPKDLSSHPKHLENYGHS